MDIKELDEEAIFNAARQIAEPEARNRYLDQACARDSRLRARLDALLRINDQEPGFLQSPAIPLQSSGSADLGEQPGLQIGHYKLIEQIGEGGFAVVFRAEQQEPVQRMLAMKILKPGMDTRQIVARFEAERQALALMDHPNIARVLDAGATARGRPFFVMELVRGAPITRYCDEHQLTPRDRLNLFAIVCQAVQHAHQKGIIHRDLKPSNVLVAERDGKPVPKVIDFGVAKALGHPLTGLTQITGLGDIVGTLEYMSPEQAEFHAMDIDTRADIYSLGVLLYELLTGSTPLTKARLKHAAITEALRLIREEDPPKPSARLSDSRDSLASISALRKLEPTRLTREVRGELDLIVMKCLEKDRARRYETANGLARDIERHLQDEPVEASPPSAVYRFRKFARKNRKLIAAVVVFVSLLASGAGVSSWLALKALAAEQRARAAQKNEAEQLRQAKQSEARAQAVLKFFQDKVLSATRPKGQEGGLGKEATIQSALNQAEPDITRLFVDQPLVEASIRNVLGVSYWYLGKHDMAMRQQERALALRRQELGPEHPETVGAMNDLGIILHAQGQIEKARKLFAEVVEVKKRVLGPEDPITLRSVNNLASTLAEEGNLQEASRLIEETLQIQRRLLGAEDLFTLRSSYNLAIMLRHLGRTEESRKLFQETLEILQRVFGKEHQDTLRVMNELGELMLDQGEIAEAHKLFEETLQGKRRILGATHDETLLTLANLADASRLQGRLDDARKLAEEAVRLDRREVGVDHPQTSVALAILASVYRDGGQYAEADKLYTETLALQRRVLGPKTPEMQKSMNAYAWMLATAADPKFLRPERAIELAKEVIQNAPRAGDKWSTIGVAYYRNGDLKNALAALEKFETPGPARSVALNSFFRAMAYWQAGQKQKAREWYGKALVWESKASLQPDQELMRFRAEAAKLLGISSPQPPIQN
jgi:serine/threonine protein kinase/Flp pilus assembly protein TadD